MEKENAKGRKRKYKTEELQDIIDKYILSNEFIVKLKYTELEEFAKSNLGIASISYQDFRRNTEIKNAIDKFNSTSSLLKANNKKCDFTKVVKFNVDEFVNKYTNNPNMQKVILNVFNEKYEYALKELCKKNKIEEEYQDKINDLKNQLQISDKKNRELSVKNRELSKVNSSLKKRAEFLFSIDLCEDLISRGIIEHLNEENISLLLKRAGLIDNNEMIDIDKDDGIFTIECISNKFKSEEVNDEEIKDDTKISIINDNNSVTKNIKQNREKALEMIDFFNERSNKT